MQLDHEFIKVKYKYMDAKMIFQTHESKFPKAHVMALQQKI